MVRKETALFRRFDAATGQREKIDHIKCGPVAKVGQRVAEDFQHGDARIMQVVVGPDRSGEALDVFDPFFTEKGVILGGKKRLVLIYDGGFVHNCYAISLMMWV